MPRTSRATSSPQPRPRRLNARRACSAALAALALTSLACGAPRATPQGPPPSGPGRVLPEVVARHARQFDEDLAPRPAGSQAEEAAAAYLLGHLQRSGYVVRLLGVPVANTVSSVDVVALPPAGGDPGAVVATAYDSPAGRTLRSGSTLGIFLELARALRARAPRHHVEFVALGAEYARVGEGWLGSRRLARDLESSAARPSVVTLGDVTRVGGLRASGERAARLRAVAGDLGVRSGRALPSGAGDAVSARSAIFGAAGVDHTAVGGGERAVGTVLLEYLAATAAE